MFDEILVTRACALDAASTSTLFPIGVQWHTLDVSLMGYGHDDIVLGDELGCALGDTLGCALGDALGPAVVDVVGEEADAASGDALGAAPGAAVHSRLDQAGYLL